MPLLKAVNACGAVLLKFISEYEGVSSFQNVHFKRGKTIKASWPGYPIVVFLTKERVYEAHVRAALTAFQGAVLGEFR